MGLRKKNQNNMLQFVQKVGWGRPPKLVKETFKFDSGVGEILKVDAPHIGGGGGGGQHQQQHIARPPPPNYGAMSAANSVRAMVPPTTSTTPAQPASAPPTGHPTSHPTGHSHSGGAFMNPQRAQLIASSHGQQYNPYNPAMQYHAAGHSYNPMQAQHAAAQGQMAQQPHAAVQAQYPPQYR